MSVESPRVGRVRLWTAFLGMAAGIGMGGWLIAGSLSHRNAGEPVAGGVTVTGQVTSVDVHRAGRGGTVRQATVTFIDESGVTHSFTTPSLNTAPTQGDPALVSYDPNNPSKAHDLSADIYWQWPYYTGTLVLAMGLAAVTFIGIAVADRRRVGATASEPRVRTAGYTSLGVLVIVGSISTLWGVTHPQHPVQAARVAPSHPAPTPVQRTPTPTPAGLMTCARLVRLAPVEAAFGYVPGSVPTTQRIVGIVLPASAPLVTCAVDESSDPAMGNTKTIAYAYVGVDQHTYIRRLLASGWQDGGAGNYTYFPGSRSLQVDLIPIGNDLVILANDNTP